MPYPYTWIDGETETTIYSYSDIQSVQIFMMTYKISNSPELGERQIGGFLQHCTAEIDAVLLKAGLQVPPPAQATILPILKFTAAIGATAMVAMARAESDDETMGNHAYSLTRTYDAQLSLLERQDINGMLMGMQSAGWAPIADERKYFSTGNVGQFSSGSQKSAAFTMDMDW